MKLLAQQPAPAFEDIEDIIDLTSSEEIPDPQDNLAIKEEPISPYVIISIIGIFLVGCIIAYLLLSQKKKKETAKTPTNTLLPHEQALHDLRLIWEQEESLKDKPFASSITDTLRIYIEIEYHIKAPEQTTQEFLIEAGKNQDLKGEFAEKLKGFLEHIDLVKFAKLPLNREQRSGIYNSAVQFIEESHQSQLLKIEPELSMSTKVKQHD